MEKEFPQGQVGKGLPVGKRAVTLLLSMDALKDSILAIQQSRKIQDNVLESDGKLNPEVLRKTYSRQNSFDKFSDDTIGNLRYFRAHIPYYLPILCSLDEQIYRLPVYYKMMHMN